MHPRCRLLTIKQELTDAGDDFVTDPAEHGTSVVFRASGRRGIIKAPMQHRLRAWEDRAGFFGSVTDRDYVVELLPRKFL